MPREASFTFVPAHLEVESQKYVGLNVSLNTTTGRLSFSMKSPEAKNLIGKYLKFFIDKEKKALGWQQVQQETGFDKLKYVHQVKSVEVDGNLTTIYVSVKKYLGPLNLPENKNFKKLAVEKYAPQTLLDKPYFYVILK